MSAIVGNWLWSDLYHKVIWQKKTQEFPDHFSTNNLHQLRNSKPYSFETSYVYIRRQACHEFTRPRPRRKTLPVRLKFLFVWNFVSIQIWLKCETSWAVLKNRIRDKPIRRKEIEVNSKMINGCAENNERKQTMGALNAKIYSIARAACSFAMRLSSRMLGKWTD